MNDVCIDIRNANDKQIETTCYILQKLCYKWASMNDRNGKTFTLNSIKQNENQFSYKVGFFILDSTDEEVLYLSDGPDTVSFVTNKFPDMISITQFNMKHMAKELDLV